jgi:hypothetical protein
VKYLSAFQKQDGARHGASVAGWSPYWKSCFPLPRRSHFVCSSARLRTPARPNSTCPQTQCVEAKQWMAPERCQQK